ncbi:hypothetical protein QR680_003584 [Steinernema hermaphroditum]|uniref:Phosphatidylinositol-glycan biosynthesis class W protein n=1 Tax=Steinernema hermaphroditum TaxID=289476 RepID=A0AA39HN69_9BILA|nr:hypothetical protein QR680_003584 [Steinernema hermaphroditum]
MAHSDRSKSPMERVSPPHFTASDLAFLDELTDGEPSQASVDTQYSEDIPRDSKKLIADRQLATVLVVVTLGVVLIALTPLVVRFPIFGLLLIPYTFFVHDWIILHSAKLTRRFVPMINVKSMLAASSAYNPAFNEFFSNPNLENRVYNCCVYGPELNPDLPRTADEGSSVMDPREQFVSGHSGGSQWEVFAVQLVAPLAVVCRNLILRWIFLRPNPFSNHVWSKFWIDFVLLVTPMLLSLTLMANHVLLLVILQIATAACLILLFSWEYYFYVSEKPSFDQVLDRVIPREMGPTTFFAYMRSMLMIFTCIAILAVDFQVFPRRFAKTETFGHSVMDIGAAAFVFLMGSAEALRLSRKGSDAASLNSLIASNRVTFTLAGVGMCRSVILPLLNYQLHVTEYGVHWNFFFTLAVVKAFSIAHSFLCRGNFSLILGIIFSAVQEFILTELGYKYWILSDACRDTWLSANREGIFSILGYIAIYCFGHRVGKTYPSGSNRLQDYLWLFAELCISGTIFYNIQKYPLEYLFGQPSRRLMNLPFIFSMVGLFTCSSAMFLLSHVTTFIAWAARVPSFHLRETEANNKLNPCLMKALNAKGTLVGFFLLSNVMTGMINLSMDTIGVTNPYIATSIIGAYSASCSLIMTML